MVDRPPDPPASPLATNDRSERLVPIGDVIKSMAPRAERSAAIARQRKADFLANGGACVRCWDSGVVPGLVGTDHEPALCDCAAGVAALEARSGRRAALLIQSSGAGRFNRELHSHPNRPLVATIEAWAERAWLAALSRSLDEGTGGDDPFLLLYGATGVGKSQIAAALLRRAIRAGANSARFVSVTDLLDDLRPGGPEGARDLLNEACHAQAVVLDDLGLDKCTDFVQRVLYRVVNSRYEQRLWTVITTNRDPELPKGHEDALLTWTEDRVFYRINERAFFVNCGGPDQNLRR